MWGVLAGAAPLVAAVASTIHLHRARRAGILPTTTLQRRERPAHAHKTYLMSLARPMLEESKPNRQRRNATVRYRIIDNLSDRRRDVRVWRRLLVALQPELITTGRTRLRLMVCACCLQHIWVIVGPPRCTRCANKRHNPLEGHKGYHDHRPTPHAATRRNRPVR